MLIYFAEDDNSIRELVAYTLHSAGFEAEVFERPFFLARLRRKTTGFDFA